MNEIRQEQETAIDRQAVSNLTLLSTKEAAAYFGVSQIWLAKRRLEGNGPIFRKIGRRVIYARRDLESYLDACARRSTSDCGSAA